MQRVLTDAVVFTSVVMGLVFAYAIMNLVTMSIWWWCWGERPSDDYTEYERDSLDALMDSLESPSRWQNACGWLWPIFIVPVCGAALARGIDDFFRPEN